MADLLDTLNSGRVVLMDGAMGTELIRAGLPPGQCHECWDAPDPGMVRSIHETYVRAGARCLLTNTFLARRGAHPSRGSSAAEWWRINKAALRLARVAGGKDCFVLGDIGPPITEAEDDEALRQSVEHICEQMDWLAAADALLLETFSSVRLVRAIISHPSMPFQPLPIIISFAFDES